ncbi:MAG: Crp/Fnr family transcriptional regulator [Elusimicrobia bacterium]|nr:Crp/Fnr family transcriptional regulator [Elusimicrobiota bacterium]MDE2424708.1 Crp/Fnr family transcriptional regulator [Elusimicrobiota bacterium]
MDYERRRSSSLDKALASFPFSRLPEGEIRRLRSALRPERFGAGETIFREGEPAGGFWAVLEGTVRIVGLCGGMRPVALERLGPGQLFGLYCRAGGGGEYPCTALAEREVLAARVPDSAYQRWLGAYPEFARGIVAACAGRLARMRRAAVSGREGVEPRLARALLLRSRADGAVVRMTRRELAGEVGSAVETVFRVLARWRRRGWLATGRGQVLIKKPEKLAHAACRYDRGHGGSSGTCL